MPREMLPAALLSQYPHGLAFTPKSSSRLECMYESMQIDDRHVSRLTPGIEQVQKPNA